MNMNTFDQSVDYAEIKAGYFTECPPVNPYSGSGQEPVNTQCNFYGGPQQDAALSDWHIKEIAQRFDFMF